VRDLKPSPVRAEEADLSSYRLGAVIRRSPAATVYRTEFRAKDGTELPAVIKVRELDAAGAAAAVRQWSGAMKLEHPHLLRLYAAGSSAIDHATAAWVVMERAEESLAGVLTERALSEDEVGEMLVPAVSALAYLHRNGYAHGAIQPSNVLACGDQLKMSCDNALRVSEGGVPAEDIRALGALIAEALTERGPHGVVRHPSGRFSEIVRHCSDPNPAKRWTAEQIGARLHEKETETVSEAAAVAESQAASSRATRSRGFPMWIFAGLAAVVLAVMLAAVLRTGNNKPASAAPVAAPPVASAVPDVASSAPPPLIEPAPAAAPAPPIVKPKPFPEAPHSKARKADGWYVIVAAYGSHDAAEKRMDTLARRWPGFQLRVSEHSAERAPWLVTLGENLSEDEAESLRARAVHAGVARDAYIKRMR
jgi:cell division septation protein DedD